MMVGLHEILDQDFPVPVAVEFQRANDRHIVQPELLEIGLECFDLRRKGQRVLVKIRENEALPDFGANLRQAAA